MIRLLLVSSKPSTETRLERLLASEAVSLARVETRDGLFRQIAREDIDLVLIEDALLPEPPSELFDALDTLPEQPGVIVLAERDSARERARLLASGCRAVLWHGLEDDVLGTTLVSLARREGDNVRERLGAERIDKRSTLSDFAASSEAMGRFVELARRVAPSESPLLILGETGVGKERLARSMHCESPRASGPFIAVNCGALPETLLDSELFGHEEGAFTGAIRARRGYFELAHRGTLFLDEIGEMPLHLQVKLLRVLEDGSVRRVGSERPVLVDVRIIAATNRDLETEMSAGKFREDLYYRLAVVTLTVPPLRERREDIPELARSFLKRAAQQLGRPVSGFRPEALEALERHGWRGNVRELINVIERAVLLAPGSEIRLEDLRGEPWTAGRGETSRASVDGKAAIGRPLSEARAHVVAAFERAYLTALLTDTRGRVGSAARRAGVNERTLYAMMRRHGLHKEDFKERSGSPQP